MIRNLLLLVLLAGISISPLLAQNKDGAVTLPDTLDYPYIHITGIEISGNKLTKERIITRELDFKTGDSLETFERGKGRLFGQKRYAPADSSQLKLILTYSRENLINTNLFLTVNLAIRQIEGNRYHVVVTVTERHYWWLFPVIKLNAPNFNEWLRDPVWSDVSMGLFFSHNNLFGSSQQMSLVGYVGKSYAAAWGYKIPWIGRGEKISLTFGAAYQNLYTVEYGSVENKRQMLYANNSFQNLKLSAQLQFRPGLYNYITTKLTGEWVAISDSLFALDTNYLGKNLQTNKSLSLYADYYYDSRNSHTYPLDGSFMRVFVNKIGLGLIVKDIDIFYYGTDLHFYQKLSRKFYVAEMVKLEGASGQDYPYYYQLNMEYKKDFIRGYDLFTLKGDQMYYFRSNLKYELIKPSIRKLPPKDEKNKFKALQYAFYLNLFFDGGYVVNKFTTDNPYCNKMLFSTGLGLDFVSYYDLVLRFEYAFTSVGTNGFFIGFGMPI